MTEQNKTVEWGSVNEALEDAVAGIFVGVTDNGWDATPIPTLEQDTIEIDVRVPYASGWLPGEDENGVLICRKAMGEDFEINALGTFNLLESTRRYSPKATFIYSSTNKVYGEMEDLNIIKNNGRYMYKDLPQGVDETRNLDFHSPYGCSKGAADQYCRDYYRIYGLKTIVLRQSCIYGYRQFGIEDQGWVAWFCIATALGKPITIFGDGKQIRDVLFIDDLIKAFELAYKHRNKACGQVFNIGGGPENTLSLHELIDSLERQKGKKIPVNYDDWRPGDQKVFVGNIAKAKKQLGWEPTVNPTEGVKKLYKWVIDNKELFH